MWLNQFSRIFVKTGQCKDGQSSPKVEVKLRGVLRGAWLKHGQGETLCQDPVTLQFLYIIIIMFLHSKVFASRSIVNNAV